MTMTKIEVVVVRVTGLMGDCENHNNGDIAETTWSILQIGSMARTNNQNRSEIGHWEGPRAPR
jgi:hypothetical protein